MSWERSCNQGVRVGRVIDRRHEEVLVAFEGAVDAGDTLEVRFIPGPNDRQGCAQALAHGARPG